MTLRHVLLALGVIITSKDSKVNAAHVQLEDMSQLKTSLNSNVKSWLDNDLASMTDNSIK